MRFSYLRASAALAAVMTATALAGCLVGPNYHRPSAPTPTVYKEAKGWAPANPSDAADKKDWWTVFGDPTLNSLEERVEVSNQNLIAAEAAYRQARALVAEQRAQLFPVVNLTGGAGVSRGGQSGFSGTTGTTGTTGTGTTGTTGTGTTGTGTTAAASTNRTVGSYSVGVGATWAPDIWGAVRRAIEDARANAQASAADLANARLTAQMEVANDYIALRQYDEQKRLLDLTVTAYKRSLLITENKYRAGAAARSDVLTAQALLDSTEAQAVALISQRAVDEHAIAVLTGVPPADLTLPAAAWNLKLPLLPTAVPTTLLERRPDISASERLMAAANAEIGVNVAAYYPTLNLTGQAGFASNELGNLFTAPNFAWSAAAQAVQTLFNGGLTHAKVEAARAAFDQAVATYRQTVLSAFEQVEDNLAAQGVLGSEESLQQTATNAAVLNQQISLNEYQAGQVDYTTVVTAQATALQDQIALLQTQASRLTTAVDLIAALGGGWSTADLPKKP
jgi:NodT family efflux transporter outer membrane factor (OMF) lipoprotein